MADQDDRADGDAPDLAGKTVVVTGGASGLGLATVRELARRGADVVVADLDPDVRANAVCPGVVETPMLESAAEDDEDLQEMIERTPLDVGQPEDVANAVAYLASDRARYVTGSVLTVDGGYTAR